MTTLISTLIIGTFNIFIIHYVADYLFQKGTWASDKSTDVTSLLKHTVTYSLIWLIPMVGLLGVMNGIIFVVVTFILHTIQDYITSPVVKRMFENEKYYTDLPNGGVFSFMGFDQFLHYLQLYGTFIFLLLL